MASTRLPLRARKLDTIYVAWFAIHLLIMFTVDLVPLYPASMRPTALLQMRKWYIATYNDRQFTHPTGWFTAYAWLELIYHVPLSLWAVYALIEDHPLVPVHLLIWAVETAVTTLTCMADYFAWPGLTLDQRYSLDTLYGPYLLLGLLFHARTRHHADNAALMMGADMTYRLHKKLAPEQKTKRH